MRRNDGGVPPTMQIGEIKNGEYHLRGVPITQLMRDRNFISVAWFAWTCLSAGRPGEWLDDKKKKLIEACFIACVDHGAEPPSAVAVRSAAKDGKTLGECLAAGFLQMNERHGFAGSVAAKWLIEAVASGQSAEMIVKQAVEQKKILAGLGHREYEVDPRAEALITLAHQTLDETKHGDFIKQAAAILSALKGKPMPVNLDGALGAIVADLHVAPEIADAIFSTARTVGLVTHVYGHR